MEGAVMEFDLSQLSWEPLCAAELEGKSVPERVWNVENYLPHGEVGILGGNGGEGKTTLALQLAVAKSAKLKWLGLETRPGRTLFVSAEDDWDELHRRLSRMRIELNLKWSDLEDVHLMSFVGDDIAIGAFNRQEGRVIATPRLTALERCVRDRMIDSVVLDTLSDVFRGDENEKQQARAFIHLLKGLAIDTDTSILALAHPSLSGMASGAGTSGSVAWNNTCRVRLYFRSIGDTGIRKLQVMKANYGPADLCVHVRWQRGVYVPVSENEVPAEPKAKKQKIKPNSNTMHGLLSMAMPIGLTQEEWNAKGRDQGIGARRRSDLFDCRRELLALNLVHECNGRWFTT
jgi:RecA-family ATPase